MRTFFSCLFLFLGISFAHAADEIAYHHNGSIVVMQSAGKQVTIRYLTPRPGLPDFVQRGTLLFDGGVNERSRRIEGEAWIFNARCGHGFPYWVVGDFIDGDTQLVLRGPVPVIGAACGVIGSTWRNSNSLLIFDIDAE